MYVLLHWEDVVNIIEASRFVALVLQKQATSMYVDIFSKHLKSEILCSP